MMIRRFLSLFACVALLGCHAGRHGSGTRISEGAYYELDRVPRNATAVVHARSCISFDLEESPKSGYAWEVEDSVGAYARIEHRGGRRSRSGKATVTVCLTSSFQGVITLVYRPTWSDEGSALRTMNLVVHP